MDLTWVRGTEPVSPPIPSFLSRPCVKGPYRVRHQGDSSEGGQGLALRPSGLRGVTFRGPAWRLNLQ